MVDKTCPQRKILPRTLWNVGLNDSLVNVPKTCQHRCEINIYAHK